MVASSKVFQWPINRTHCAQVLHSLPNQTCTEAYIWNLYRNHVSSAKYYLPVLLFPLLFQCRKLNKRRVSLIVKNYLQSSSFASVINASTFYLMCIFRRINGRFICAYSPFISCCLASQLVWLAPPNVLEVYAPGIFHSAIEAILRRLDVGLVHSHSARTMVFMLCSLIVMRQQQMKAYSGFWFIKPDPLPHDYDRLTFKQRGKNAILELRTYLAIGLALDFLNAALRRQIKKINFKSTSFMISYMGMYRFIQCVLAARIEQKHTNLLAAFLSGGAFWFVGHMPLTLMSLAVYIACQLLWKEFCTLDVSNNRLLTGLQRISWEKWLLPPNLAYITHCTIFEGHLVNALTRSFIDSTCDKNAQRIADLFQLPSETILTTTKKLSAMPFFFHKHINENKCHRKLF